MNGPRGGESGRLLLLAGTSDAIGLAAALRRAGYPLLASVVTVHAQENLAVHGIKARAGRLDLHGFLDLLARERIEVVVDASHPFAEEAHHTAIQAAQAAGVPYLRYERAAARSATQANSALMVVPSYEAAAEEASRRKGTILLTTGIKTLAVFTQRLLGDPAIHLIARLVPRVDNLQRCTELGLEQRQIIALQGPFSRELNAALFRQYGVTLLISKESGPAGSVDEKVETALAMGIEVLLITRPIIEYGQVFTRPDALIQELQRLMPAGEGGEHHPQDAG